MASNKAKKILKEVYDDIVLFMSKDEFYNITKNGIKVKEGDMTKEQSDEFNKLVDKTINALQKLLDQDNEERKKINN